MNRDEIELTAEQIAALLIFIIGMILTIIFL